MEPRGIPFTDIPSLVRGVRRDRGLTQEQLARELGVTFGTVNGWENGKHQPIPLLKRQLRRLARRGPRLPGARAHAMAGRELPAPVIVDESTKEEVPQRPHAWPPTKQERADFYHRVREFPTAVHEWRETLVGRIMSDREAFPLVPNGSSRELVRERLDEALSLTREIARLLETLHGTPDLGNHRDPVDELVYIILSRKTREAAYQRTFSKLKKRFKNWDDLLDAPTDVVGDLVREGGLETKKTASLFGALGALRSRFGTCTLEPARSWADDELEAFLCGLPEVGKKSAFCIMMYSMGRHVFPVDTHVGRVLARLSPLRDLGFNLEGLDHKQLQSALQDIVPPNLRHSLHVNLVVHGREVCTSQSPRCGDCELRKLCGHYRRIEQQKGATSSMPVVFDVFSGAGGLSLGFSRAGFRLLGALDSDPVALKTLKLNHPEVADSGILARSIEDVSAATIRKILGRRRLDVLLGAPPCQGFSAAGFRSKALISGYRVAHDDRNFLFEHLVRLAIELRPRLFLMENVPGMRTAIKDSVSFLESAARMLEHHGRCRTAVWQLNACSLGVPQERQRCFLVASWDERLPPSPRQDYQDTRKPGLDVDALPPVTVDEAIFDLPPRAAGTGEAVDRWDQDPAVAEDRRTRRYLAKFRLRSSTRVIYNHVARYNNSRDLELYSLLKPGEDSVHAIEKYGRGDLMRYRRDVFDDKYARLRGDRPSKTIVAHLAKDGNGYIHPSQTRSLTIREAARLQSFPDDYVFCGSPSDQWVQIGNAVPPVLAESIATTFLKTLEARK